MANTTAHLKTRFPRKDFRLLDSDYQMLQMGLRNCWGSEAYLEDILKLNLPLPAVDMIHSHGLLEHFEDIEVLGLVKQYGHCRQVHYVPGLYDAPSFGDERLLPLDHWVELLQPTKAFTFNDGLDYCLIFEPSNG